MRLEHVAGRSGRYQFFSGWWSALRHIADHLLAAPETLAWRLIAPSMEEVIPDARLSARKRMLASMLAPGGDGMLQRVYDAWSAVAQVSLARSERQTASGPAGHDDGPGWTIRTPDGKRAWMDPYGVILLVDETSRVVKTTLILGPRFPRRRPQEHEYAAGIPRDKDLSSIGRRPTHPYSMMALRAEGGLRSAVPEAHRNRHTFEVVVLPALTELHRLQFTHPDPPDWAHLSRVVPGSIDFDTWQRMV